MAHYPTLSSSAVSAAVPEPIAQIETVTAPDVVENLPKRKQVVLKTSRLFYKFVASCRNLRHRFKKLEDPPVEAIPSENPDIAETPTLVKLVESKAQPFVLLQNGFSVDTMNENDILLQDFRDSNYTLQDLHRLFPTWTSLKQAGFTKHHMDSELWSLDLLSSLFQSEQQYSDLVATNSFLLAREMEFTLDDYLRTMPNINALAAILNADALLQHDIKFRHIFKMHLTPECFKNEFGATKEHFLALRDRVNETQFRALASGCNWNMYNLRRVFDIQSSEIPLKLVIH